MQIDSSNPRDYFFSSPTIGDDLRQLYLTEHRSQRQIASIFGVCYMTVSNTLKKYGIPTRKLDWNPQEGKPVTSRETGFSSLYKIYERGAKQRGLCFELSEEQFRFLTKQACFYCGIPPYRVKKPCAYVYNGIDRIDSTQGYTMANTHSCCWHCNMAKGTLTEQEFTEWLCRVALHRFQRANESEILS